MQEFKERQQGNGGANKDPKSKSNTFSKDLSPIKPEVCTTIPDIHPHTAEKLDVRNE